MNERKLKGNKVLKLLTDNIVTNLNELFENKLPSAFNEGGRYAYIECLEIISKWSHFSRYGIADIENKYPIK